MIILPSIDDGSAVARIGYDNLMERAGAVITPSSEDGDFPVENLYDWKTQDFYKPAGTGTITIDVDLTGSEAANYFAIYNQTLYLNAGTVKLQYHNGSGYVDASSTITSTSNAPVMAFFEPKTSNKWRIVIGCSVIPAIGVVSFGQYLGLPRGMYREWCPPFLADDDQILNSEATGGSLLGRSVISEGFATTLELNKAPDAWMRSEWKTFVGHAKKKPFFFSHNVEAYPGECAFCWTDGKIPPPSHSANGFMDAKVPIKGRVE